MYFETGLVVDVSHHRAKVQVQRSTLCDKCASTSLCRLESDTTSVVEVADPIGVQVDQEVRVGIQPKTLLMASFIAYMVPLLALIAGAAVGVYAATRAPGNHPWWPVFGAAVGLVFSLLLVRAVSKRSERRGQYLPTVIEVLD